jgi:hypothetical protein
MSSGKAEMIIEQGCDFGPYICTFNNEDETPMDLTGCVVSGTIRETINSNSPYAHFVCSVLDQTANPGGFSIYIPAEKIPPTLILNGIGSDKSELVYTYSFRIRDSGGRPRGLIRGNARIVGQADR